MNNLLTLAEIPRPSQDPTLAKEAAKLILIELANQPTPDPEDTLHLLHDMDNRVTVVAQDNERVLSAGGLRISDDGEAFIVDVATDHDYRGQGLGAGVIRTLEGIARDKGVQTLQVHPTIEAEHFYESLGYVDEESAYTKQL